MIDLGHLLSDDVIVVLVNTPDRFMLGLCVGQTAAPPPVHVLAVRVRVYRGVRVVVSRTLRHGGGGTVGALCRAAVLVILSNTFL